MKNEVQGEERMNKHRNDTLIVAIILAVLMVASIFVSVLARSMQEDTEATYGDDLNIDEVSYANY